MKNIDEISVKGGDRIINNEKYTSKFKQIIYCKFRNQLKNKTNIVPNKQKIRNNSSTP